MLDLEKAYLTASMMITESLLSLKNICAKSFKTFHTLIE